MTDTSKEPMCCAGCISFDGGERKHLKECVFYPESRTKMFDDVCAERDALRLNNVALMRERTNMIKTKREQLDRLKSERDALQATNAEMLKALKDCADNMEQLLDQSENCGDYDAECPMQDAFSSDGTLGIAERAREAISKGEGKL